MAKPIIKVEPNLALSDITQVVGGIDASTVRAPHYRTALGVNNRDAQVMTWRLPSGSAVQMYINPQSFVVNESKQISEVRTKGGFVIQYWGENLIQLTINGTTGSSGIRGINVLRDIYKSESRGFDLIAAQLTGDIRELKNKADSSGNLNSLLTNVVDSADRRNFLMRPSLAAMAVNVLLFYQGIEYKGFFKSFHVTEGVDQLGLFNYSISFTATETRGQRKNFMGWHKEPAADDFPGQLINAVGNSIRGIFGLSPQPPTIYHPATAPLSFGGGSIASGLTGASDLLTENRTIFV